MYFLKIIAIFVSLFFFLLASIILHIIISIIPICSRWRAFSFLNRIFAAALRNIAGAKIVVEGRHNLLKKSGSLIISNHLTYLDGVIIGSLFPVIYLSKGDIKKWPLINTMSIISGTIFIDRKRKNLSHSYVEQIGNLLKNKTNVLVFPEGTSTDGTQMRSFQTVFFQAPLEAGAKVLPITINYKKINKQPFGVINRDSVCWYGQVPFANHISNLLRLGSIEAEVRIHPLINLDEFQQGHSGRKKLASFSREIIEKDFTRITT